MATIPLLTAEPQGEATLLAFYRLAAGRLGPVERTVLNSLARPLVERGWLPPLRSLLELLEHEAPQAELRKAVARLVHLRLIELDTGWTALVGLLGSISLAPTEHRAHLSSGVDVYTSGGMDLLAVNPMLTKDVDAFTACGQCSAPITLRVAGETITEASPSGIAGFQANWDGRSSIPSSVGARSPLFCSDRCLATWQEAHPEVEGLPMAADLLLFVGMGMAVELGNARFEMVRLGG